MTLQQLRYILAVADSHSFAAAAQKRGVTQPTLSAMVAKLEAELAVQIFDRKRKPVAVTQIGEQVIKRARRVLAEAAAIPDLIANSREQLDGNLRIGILPTIAPYLLPRFIQQFTKDYAQVILTVHELKTVEIIEQIATGQLDVGIIATPYQGLQSLQLLPLFEEAFFAYAKTPSSKAYILPKDIDPNELWVLEEGHCFGDQVLNLCALSRTRNKLNYASGSIDTLKRLVEAQGGVTVLPELALATLTSAEKAKVRPFVAPSPTRTVTLATKPDFVRTRLLRALKDTIIAAIEPPINALPH